MTERYSVTMNSDTPEDGWLLIDSQEGNAIIAVFEQPYHSLAKDCAKLLNAEEPQS